MNKTRAEEESRAEHKAGEGKLERRAGRQQRGKEAVETAAHLHEGTVRIGFAPVGLEHGVELRAQARARRDGRQPVELEGNLLQAGPFALAVEADLEVFAHGAGVGRGKAAVLIIEKTFLDALAVHGGRR